VEPLIVQTPDVLFGAPRIAGTRIPVSLIVDKTKDGFSSSDIQSELSLTAEQVSAALRFNFEENRMLALVFPVPSTPDSRIRVLRAELAQLLDQDFAAKLLRAAQIWRELTDLGDDLSDLRSGLLVYLPAIAAGTILPETVVRFAGQPTLLRAVTALTPDEQRRLTTDGTVSVVSRVGDTYSHRPLPVSALTTTQIKQVFASRSIRTESEQVALLSSPPPRVKPNRPIRRGKIEVDATAGTVRIGNSSAAVPDVLHALAAAGLIEPRKRN
jgi:uncharacterized protein (DUF433 family)